MGHSSAPAPDPAIGEASLEQIDLARQEYADQQALVAQYSPLYQQQIQLSLAQQEQDQAHSATLWNNYEQNTLPMIQQFQQEARDYNTEGRQTQAAQSAEAAVATNYDTARQQQVEQMQAAGVQPGSGRALALQGSLNLDEARAKAAAGNNARRQTELTGLSLQGQAINVGQGMPAMGLQQQAAGQQAGGQAQGSVAGLSGLTAAPLQYSAPGYTSGINGLIGYNNLQQQRFATQHSFLGDAMQAGAMAYGMYQSSKGVKDRVGDAPKGLTFGGDDGEQEAPPARASAEDRAALKGLTARKADGKPAMPVDRWKYHQGQGDGGMHDGPYAEDVQHAFGDQVAPGGKGINMPAMMDKNEHAIRALTAEVQALREQAKRLGA